MVTKLLDTHSNAICKVVVVGNLSPTTAKGKFLLRKWLRRASFRFIVLKFFEIYIDTFAARLKRINISKICSDYEVDCVRIVDQNQSRLEKELDLNFDYLISTGPAILSEGVLKKARLMNLNLHGGDLPSYKGMANYVWMLLANETYAYVTLHELVLKIDSGATYLRLALM